MVTDLAVRSCQHAGIWRRFSDLFVRGTLPREAEGGMAAATGPGISLSPRMSGRLLPYLALPGSNARPTCTLPFPSMIWQRGSGSPGSPAFFLSRLIEEEISCPVSRWSPDSGTGRCSPSSLRCPRNAAFGTRDWFDFSRVGRKWRSRSGCLQPAAPALRTPRRRQRRRENGSPPPGFFF